MDTQTARWEHFEHESDIGVRGIAPTLAGAFEQAALALMAVVTELSTVCPREITSIECEAHDVELLLVDWLDALVYQMSVGKRIFARFEAQIDGTQLRARCDGEPLDVARHEPAVEVKGATLCDLKVEQVGATWIAQCVVDV